MNRNIESLREKANNLPLLPGVYVMMNDACEVIYVGKAKKLKNRVSSYFHGEHLPKVEAMVDKVADFEVIIANSEFEALVLENSLIKRHNPHYNILLKDDKGYPFIKVDIKSEYPTISISSRASKDGAKYYGPFGGRGTTRKIIESISETVMLPDCSRKLPDDIGKKRPCLNYQIGRCAGWCLEGKSREDYMEAVNHAVMILDGKSGELIDDLTAQMTEAADKLLFEKAAKLRDRIRAVNGLAEKQRVIFTGYNEMDAIGIYRGEKTCFSVLHFNNGDMTGKDVEILDDPLEEDSEALLDFLAAYYTPEHCAGPKLILIPYAMDSHSEAEELLSSRYGRKVRIEIPQRGDRLRCVETACLNAAEEVQRRLTEREKRSRTLEKLGKMLALKSFPHRIEAFDISNLGKTGIVSGMTVFVDGKPSKKDYRRFRIRDLDSQDDYASMYQAVYRRFRHCIEGDSGFEEFPDLLLIDGGAEHAGKAEEALRELGCEVPVFGMVKDDRHRTRALISSNGCEIAISGNQALFAFIGTVQEETHRFSIEYQRKLRYENMGMSLDDIPGIGEKRRVELLKHFKSVKAIKEADVETLKDVLPEKVARAVFDYYHNGEE